MDLPNLENYPVYILNMVPELSDEGNISLPEQITSNESLPYNFYVPNIEQHVPLLNTESVLPVTSRTSNDNILVKKLLSKKTKLNTTVNKDNNFETRASTISDKYVNELSSLLKDEDILEDNNEVIKYDPKTDTNVVFYLVRPSDVKAEDSVKIKITKRGRPRKNVLESTLNKTKQDEPPKPFKPENTIDYPLVTTKSGRLCKPPKHLQNKNIINIKKNNQFVIVKNEDNIGRKRVKYNVKSDFVCRKCGKTYLGHTRMQEHLEKFPTHKINTTEQKVDSELQNIFQNFHDETPTNSMDIINNKKEIHTQTEVLKKQHCGYMKSKKNLAFHMKQVIKHLKKANIIKSLSGTISPWDLLSNTLENENLQAFSKELNTLFTNLKNVSKSLKLVSKCKSTPIDCSQMYIDDTLGHLLGLPSGSYSLQTTQNNYEMEQASNIWTLNSTKTIESKVTAPQNLNRHSSPIHLNLFDNQSSKVDFLLSSSIEESIMCDENQAALESVDGLVSERLRTMADHLHSNVPIIDYPIVSTSSASNNTQQDSFMGHGVYEVFTNDLNLVSTSTEEFIKSLEQFEPLNDTDNTLSTETRMLDFEDLQHTFSTA